MNRTDALDAWRRGLMGDAAAAEVPAGPGVLGRALDYASRPVSGVMGGFFGALSPEVTVGEGISQGLKGERYFSAFDFLVEGGFDPDARSTKLMGLAADVLNPADPLNYVGLGWTRAGKVAVNLSKAGEGAKSFGKVLSRSEGAAQGLWSPLTFAGHGVPVPKFVSENIAAGLDSAGARITRSKFVSALSPYLGGVKKMEGEFPGVTSMVQGKKREMLLGEEQFAAEMAGMERKLVEAGFGKSEAADAMEDVFQLLERPEARLARVERELSLVDDALAGKFVEWLPAGIPAEEAEALTRVNFANQRAVDRRVAELEQLTAAAPRALETGGRDAIRDELHVLKSVQAARFARDMPPMEVLAKERERLAGEVDKITRLWDEAGPADRAAYGFHEEKRQEIFGLYMDRLKGLDPDVEMPVEDYLKHMFPAAYATLPKNMAKAREAVAAEREALVLKLAGEGYDDAAIARMVREQMGDRLGLLNATDSKGLLKGNLDAFKTRQYDMTIDEFNQWATGDGKKMRFETYSAAILSAMYRDASRWSFGYDIHKFVADKPGWTIGAEEFGKLSRAEQKGWTAMDFHVPWIDQAKNPFAGKYMKKEVQALVGSQLRGMEQLLTDDGLNGVLGVLNTAREWWTAWTLAPFPSTRVRDLVSDIALANQAGLNPAIDLAKAPMGGSMYMASMALNQRRSKIPAVRGMAGEAPASLNNVLAKVQARFPELTEEKLVEYMEIEGVLGTSSVRGLDMEKVLSNDPLMKASAAREKRGLAKKAAGFLHPDPEKSPIVKAGFGVAQKTADFSRGALFFDSLMKHLPEAQNMDDALTAASATVRKFLFDYMDLTKTERDVLKNIMPFYTFTSKNLPLQLTQAATDPGRMQWINRLYQGAWGQFEEGEIKNEDLPHWLRDGMGMPIESYEEADGTKGYAIWSPRGWLPQTELNEMADLIRGKAGSALVSRLNPLLKEPFEQALNRDAFTMREIEDGTIRDVMGIPMNRRAAHLINNLRLVTEVDRLDPGGAWTKIGQHMGWWEGERPHRWQAPGPERATRFFTGLNIKGVAPEQQAERRFRDADREANAALSRARYALRRGQTLEAAGFMEEVQAQRAEGLAAMSRLNELRRRNALDVAKAEAGR